MQISDVIAIIAIVVSFANVVFQLIWEKIQKRKEKRMTLFKEVYKKIFLEELPRAHKKIQYTDYKLTGISEMKELIQSVRLNAYLFEYVDKNFKKQIIMLSKKIEDILVDNEDKPLSNEEYRKTYDVLEENVKDLYDLVFKRMF